MSKRRAFTQPIPRCIAADMVASVRRQYCISEMEVWTVEPDSSSAFFNCDPSGAVVDLHVMPVEDRRIEGIMGFVCGYVSYWAKTMVANANAA